ncbi:MAG: GNAT family N-acetyltransferase [Rhizobacter sp.]|nr:GNAT family N-acetyltransferase [Ferruginibacter sp.]
MRIRTGTQNDLTALQQLFANTVATICRDDYSEEQINVWISSALKNDERWQHIFAGQFLLVAEEQDKITGFCSLAKNGYLDFLYVHIDHQGKGIAAALYRRMEEAAISKGAAQLTADVSTNARYFFEKIGFDMLAEQTVIRQGVELNNFKMRKELFN